MDKLLCQLEEILSRESDLHNDLLLTANSFNKAIKSDNLEQIQQYTALHDEQVYQIAKLEEQRIECATNLARTLELPGEVPKMSSVLEKIPEHWQTRLSGIQLKLKQQIADLSKINTFNRILLQENLSFINSNIVMFQKSTSRSYRYGGKGKPASVSSGRNLINRVV